MLIESHTVICPVIIFCLISVGICGPFGWMEKRATCRKFPGAESNEVLLRALVKVAVSAGRLL